jgi:hypothetical protein
MSEEGEEADGRAKEQRDDSTYSCRALGFGLLGSVYPRTNSNGAKRV